MATAITFVAACSSTTQGTPNPAPSSTNATGLPRAGAPKVANPLKTGAFESKPCQAATNTEIESAGGKLESAELQPVGNGQSCLWIFADLTGTINGAMNLSEPDGLSHFYALKAQGSGLTTFKPLPDIAGYPAVVFANGGENKGVCNLAVGVRDNMMYTLVTRLFDGSPGYNDPCGVNVKIAEFAVKHLKEAQS
ncbi:DUF3558 domain-containing protein [Amycolatopsis sp. H20-H5]|uniref:DUF3558 domain-containing protein n=1 Tax=Amycolatopsis sp. H20-H5 TaxID=3046309 RepID=UPI002DBC9137|nr:DUF3558 domain-containing protein [Amycolatopsis sp. H20-H5]MEC3980654.1 DUF3558 domain-containing protein [Amycolatopsis sp. H20-H5]